MKYALGVDIGTTGIKVVAINKNGGILYETQKGHDLISEKPGFAEEDPNLWWKNTLELLKETVDRLGSDASGIGVSGMVPTLILLDENGDPLRLSIQQNDSRAVEEIAFLKSQVDEETYFHRTGNVINQQVIFPKFLWLRCHEAEIVDKARYIMGSYNFITYKLTNVPSLDVNWALESGMWDIHKERWCEDIFNLVDLPGHLLPPVRRPHEIIGSITENVSNVTGLKPGTPVITGSADHVASTLGVGAIEEGDLLVKIGGAGDILFVCDEPLTDKRLFIDYHDVPGKYLLNGCMASSGSLVKWFSREIARTDYDTLTDMASTSTTGSRGIITLPYFLGEKTPIFDPKARGVIFGLSLSHSLGDIFRSTLEAVAFGFKHHVDVIEEKGKEIKRVFLSNGGSKNPLWRSIVSDVIGHDLVYIPKNPGSSLGVAFLAAKAVGMYSDWSDVELFSKEREIQRHNPSNKKRYERYYKIYRKLYEQLKPLFEELYDIEREMRKDV
ncbi:MAG: xylulokinase [Thermotogota bacterium]|nr:xylulokinase [Thermotogota bacterium]MDK2863923.1 xylulokinase [Thermotogota bacterium]